MRAEGGGGCSGGEVRLGLSASEEGRARGGGSGSRSVSIDGLHEKCQSIGFRVAWAFTAREHWRMHASAGSAVEDGGWRMTYGIDRAGSPSRKHGGHAGGGLLDRQTSYQASRQQEKSNGVGWGMGRRR